VASTSSWRTASWRCARKVSATSWLNPFAADDQQHREVLPVRREGVCRDLPAPSRDARETAKTSHPLTASLVVKARTGSWSPREIIRNSGIASMCPARKVATSRAACWTARKPVRPSRKNV